MDIDELLTRWTSGELSEEQFAQLESLLREDPVARRRLREHAMLDELLYDCSAEESGASAPRALIAPVLDANSKWPFFCRWEIVSAGVFALLLLVAIGWWWGIARGPWKGQLIVVAPEKAPNDIAAGHEEAAKGNSGQGDRERDYVVRITRTSADCVWNVASAPTDFLLRVRAGTRLNIAAGLAELEFHSGARIILHGPTVFTPTGPAAGFLESGRLTGSVENGNFRLVTQAAEVIDLGTEFGVVADAKVGSDVVVFDGRVQVVSRNESTGDRQVLDMTEGMAARFGLNGTTELSLKTDAADFKRTMPPHSPPSNANEICLIDVLAGGTGFGDHLAGAIDPTTGEKSYRFQPGTPYHRPSDGNFHPAAWHPLIDGVFIPSGDGRQVQIDSAGHRVDLPAGSGKTYKLVWARSKRSINQLTQFTNDDFWGSHTVPGIVKRLEQVQTGLIGIHANVGITLNLQAIGESHGRVAKSFDGAVVNLENSGEFDPSLVKNQKRTVDFRVFVDGELRHSQLGFRRQDGDQPFHIALHPSDRFLTIVSGDDGSFYWDQALLIDPVISLSPVDTATK
jgi:hypothetical protein